jgi:hypothetical protein
MVDQNAWYPAEERAIIILVDPPSAVFCFGSV